MSEKRELEYAEVILIRKALVAKAYAEGTNVQDKDILERLEAMFSDASSVTLNGLRTPSHYE